MKKFTVFKFFKKYQQCEESDYILFIYTQYIYATSLILRINKNTHIIRNNKKMTFSPVS